MFYDQNFLRLHIFTWAFVSEAGMVDVKDGESQEHTEQGSD